METTSSFQEYLKEALEKKGISTMVAVRKFSADNGWPPGYVHELYAPNGKNIPGDANTAKLAALLGFDPVEGMLLVRIRMGQQAEELLQQHRNGGPKLTVKQVQKKLPR